MKFLEFQAEVEEVLADALHDLGYRKAVAEGDLPPIESYGDLASAVPIRLAL